MSEVKDVIKYLKSVEMRILSSDKLKSLIKENDNEKYTKEEVQEIATITVFAESYSQTVNAVINTLEYAKEQGILK